MPLELLGILVFVGIVIIVVTVRVAFGSPRAQFKDVEEARNAFTAAHQEAGDSDPVTYLSADNAVALSFPASQNEGVGILEIFGTKTVLRQITAKDVKRIRSSPDRITIDLNDFGMPRVEFALPSGEAGETVKREVEARLS